MKQANFLSKLCRNNKDAIIIGSIGSICYDLTNIEHPNKILVRGAMGSVMGIGLGYALNTDKNVIVVIGDGSFNMKAGSVSTIMAYRPPNLRVYILQNMMYASTGGHKINHIMPYPPKCIFKIVRVKP